MRHAGLRQDIRSLAALIDAELAAGRVARFLTAKELAHLVGRRVRTIDRWVQNGTIRGAQRTGHRRFRRKDLALALATNAPRPENALQRLGKLAAAVQESGEDSNRDAEGAQRLHVGRLCCQLTEDWRKGGYGPLLTRVKLAKLLSYDPRQVDRHATTGNIAEFRPSPRARSLYLLRDVMFSLASNAD